MKFRATIEGYAGFKDYNSIEEFHKTLHNAIKDAEPGQSIKFTISDVVKTPNKPKPAPIRKQPEDIPAPSAMAMKLGMKKNGKK